MLTEALSRAFVLSRDLARALGVPWPRPDGAPHPWTNPTDMADLSRVVCVPPSPAARGGFSAPLHVVKAGLPCVYAEEARGRDSDADSGLVSCTDSEQPPPSEGGPAPPLSPVPFRPEAETEAAPCAVRSTHSDLAVFQDAALDEAFQRAVHLGPAPRKGRFRRGRRRSSSAGPDDGAFGHVEGFQWPPDNPFDREFCRAVSDRRKVSN